MLSVFIVKKNTHYINVCTWNLYYKINQIYRQIYRYIFPTLLLKPPLRKICSGAMPRAQKGGSQRFKFYNSQECIGPLGVNTLWLLGSAALHFTFNWLLISNYYFYSGLLVLVSIINWINDLYILYHWLPVHGPYTVGWVDFGY